MTAERPDHAPTTPYPRPGSGAALDAAPPARAALPAPAAPPVPVAPPAPAPPAPAAPTRSLAPDLARGMLLLFIASANVWGYLWNSAAEASRYGLRPVGGSSLDLVVDGVVAFFVDDRSRPMFAILYGFGLATMAARLASRGADRRDVRRVIARRSRWLVVLGVAHAALLFAGDILAPYGVTGLIALAFLQRSRTVLLWWFWGSSLVATVGGALVLTFLHEYWGTGEIPPSDYLASAVERLFGSLAITTIAAVLLFFVPQVVLGILLARSGWLARPWEHRQALGRVVVVALVVNLVGNLPFALAVAQVWTPADGAVGLTVELAHYLSGVVMGFGYVCLFGWVAAVLRDRPRRGVVSAVAAVGERSLTSYLLQSVMFAPLLSAWGLGLGGRIGTAQAAVLAIGVWLVTVLVAVAMHRAGRRGPFEVLLRRLTYGRRDTRP
ncbi:DUF418 domain-containing protein [Cellulomonas cellasea]|uniref:DUF418 domain-containing protein n=1 Tax=Cellulomonas cellasea TaxID=43670 RepID=A0A4Y3KX46_9CELL|nr:DUF418 domain-containing protein [Cellulomonas cellasea]GEA87815.1 hypothetical protein CCE01nite_17640 [Cellulomonas cellasea]